MSQNMSLPLLIQEKTALIAVLRKITAWLSHNLDRLDRLNSAVIMQPYLLNPVRRDKILSRVDIR